VILILQPVQRTVRGAWRYRRRVSYDLPLSLGRPKPRKSWAPLKERRFEAHRTFTGTSKNCFKACDPKGRRLAMICCPLSSNRTQANPRYFAVKLNGGVPQPFGKFPHGLVERDKDPAKQATDHMAIGFGGFYLLISPTGDSIAHYLLERDYTFEKGCNRMAKHALLNWERRKVLLHQSDGLPTIALPLIPGT